MLHFALAPACFIYPIRLTEKKTFPKQIFVLYWKYKFDNTKIYIYDKQPQRVNFLFHWYLVYIWDDLLKKLVMELSFGCPVVSIRLRRDK